MICPRCGREMKPEVIFWHECEEYREYSRSAYFCPCCGLKMQIEVEEKEVGV